MLQESCRIEIDIELTSPKTKLSARLEEAANGLCRTELDQALVHIFFRDARLIDQRQCVGNIADELGMPKGVRDKVLRRLVLGKHRRPIR